jgi:hypothetical protein
MVTTVITGLILAMTMWTVTYGQENTEKLTAISNVTVLDANGKVVGKVQSVTFDAATAFVGFTLPSVSQPIFLGITRDRIHGAQDNVAFESTDCSGTPYLFRGLVATPPDRELSPQTAVVFPGSTLYVQDLSLSTQEIEPKSVLTRTGCIVVNIGPLTLLPAKKTFNLDEQFTAPFTTR